MDEASAVSALGALAQSMRLRVFRALIGAGPAGLTPGALAATLDVAASTLSFHLKELTHAGLVSPRQQGRYIIYAARLETLQRLMEFLASTCGSAGAQTGGFGTAGERTNLSRRDRRYSGGGDQSRSCGAGPQRERCLGAVVSGLDQFTAARQPAVQPVDRDAELNLTLRAIHRPEGETPPRAANSCAIPA